MTRRISVVLCLASLGWGLAGCQSQNSFQDKWPRYPHWGWWKHPAKDVPEPAQEEESPPDASEEQAQPAGEESPKGPATLEEHRQEVWQKVSLLRDVEELSPPEQRKLIESARRDLRRWYRPMMVDPPDPDDPQWITVLVWDFMPEDDFMQAEENWRQTARRDRLPFPEEVSRRELMEYIQKVTSGEIQPPATQPATQPAVSPAEKPKDKGKEQ
ncbi:MAG: hypothetical protein JXA11_11625 [Phycisphaerae bacterium]|nr:hypothetical protein [Phycisphaerae bacterium]